jgi:hypothetical protein
MIEIPDFRGLVRKIEGIRIPGQTRRVNPTSQIYLMDVDDTLLRTTAWHEREFEIIGEYLAQGGVGGGAKAASKLYELSKFFVPGVSEVQARYTPVVNLILIDRFIVRYQESGGDVDKALAETALDRECLQRDVIRMGEGVLDNWAYDRDLLAKLIDENPTSDFANRLLMKDLFNGENEDDLQDDPTEVPDSTVRIVITRGKIEGPLGQVYKVHQSGLMTLPNVDMVIYTNDVKVRALVGAMRLFPNLTKHNEGMILYDDNPGEIVPFYEELARGPYPLKMEVVQVRNSDSKRRDKLVMVPTKAGAPRVRRPCVSVGYAYSADVKETFPIRSFKNRRALKGSAATILDHHSLSSQGVYLA